GIPFALDGIANLVERRKSRRFHRRDEDKVKAVGGFERSGPAAGRKRGEAAAEILPELHDDLAERCRSEGGGQQQGIAQAAGVLVRRHETREHCGRIRFGIAALRAEEDLAKGDARLAAELVRMRREEGVQLGLLGLLDRILEEELHLLANTSA